MISSVRTQSQHSEIKRNKCLLNLKISIMIARSQVWCAGLRSPITNKTFEILYEISAYGIERRHGLAPISTWHKAETYSQHHQPFSNKCCQCLQQKWHNVSLLQHAQNEQYFLKIIASICALPSIKKQRDNISLHWSSMNIMFLVSSQLRSGCHSTSNVD